VRERDGSREREREGERERVSENVEEVTKGEREG
jgi:hypothetical protein